MRWANGRRDRKNGRRMDKHGNANSHIYSFANAPKNANFSDSYELCIMCYTNFFLIDSKFIGINRQKLSQISVT